MSKKKLRETKIGAFLASKAPKVLAAIGDVLPDQGTLGVVNPSLQGSLLSVDGRPPSTMSKTRNITQV